MKRMLLLFMCLAPFIACNTQSPERVQSPPAPVTAAARPASPTTALNQPEELGHVRWMRDFKHAQLLAKKTGKPMFVLFTEVPGCNTVKGFANTVLRDPLMVEVIESEFVPVVVYNNIAGADRRVLKSFKEPTWNNPVVRIIQPDRRALAPRFAGPYQLAAMTKTILKSYDGAKRHPPTYLKLLSQAQNASVNGTKKAVFSMYCFWSGETKLGGQPGVVASRTGFSGGAEVVEVDYDPNITSSKALATSFGAKPLKEGSQVRPSTKDDKYQLKHSRWRFVPLTAIQSSRVNTALGQGRSPVPFVSPRQKMLYDLIGKHPNARWPNALNTRDFIGAWHQTQRVVKSLK